MFDLEQELVKLRDALDREGIEYGLCGGLALAVHGFPRSTVDIDLLVKPEDLERLDPIVDALDYLFKSRPITFEDRALRLWRVTKVDPTDGDTLMVDFLLTTPLVAEVWAAREHVVWHGGDLWFVSRDGLITLKRFRSSKQDLADIERLQGAE